MKERECRSSINGIKLAERAINEINANIKAQEKAQEEEKRNVTGFISHCLSQNMDPMVVVKHIYDRAGMNDCNDIGDTSKGELCAFLVEVVKELKNELNLSKPKYDSNPRASSNGIKCDGFRDKPKSAKRCWLSTSTPPEIRDFIDMFLSM